MSGTIPSPTGGAVTPTTTGGTSSKTTPGDGGYKQVAVVRPPETTVEASAKSTTPATGTIPISFYTTPTASLTESALNRPGAATTLAVPLPFRGSIVALTLASDAAMTTGTARFIARLDGSNTAAFNWDMSTAQSTAFSKGEYPFDRGATLDVVVTTSADYAPTTTIVEITVFVALDQEEV